MANTYSDLLKDPRWQFKRKTILERDGYKCKNPHCQYKGSGLRLEVHHVEYLDHFDKLPPWDYSNDMLVTLCEKCHAIEQARKQVETQLCSILKIKGFFLGDLLSFSTKLSCDKSFTKSLLKSLRDMQNG